MVDNNERKAVATLLRAFSDNGLWSEFSDYCNGAGPARLADLIDPGDVIPGETCELAVDGTPEGEPLPPIVDREDLRSLTDEMFSDVEGCHDYERAPYTAGDIREIAARIERAAGL